MMGSRLPAALRSLRGRMFLATALLAVLSIGVAIYLVNVRVTRQAEDHLQREIVSTAAVVDELRMSRTQTFAQIARFVADAPKVKAAVDTNDPPTVQDVVAGYREQLGASVLLVTGKTGRVLASLGASTRLAAAIGQQETVRSALAGREAFGLVLQKDGVLQVVSEPITIGLASPEILGTLSVGFLIDNALAAQLKGITGSDIAFGVDGRVVAATLSEDSYPRLRRCCARAGRGAPGSRARNTWRSPGPRGAGRHRKRSFCVPGRRSCGACRPFAPASG
jgi:hypothetical protein